MTDLPKKLPVEPFRCWLETYVEDGFRPDLAFELGISERNLRGYMNGEKKFAPFDSVDGALQRALRVVEVDGRPIYWLDDLYPELFMEQAA